MGGGGAGGDDDGVCLSSCSWGCGDRSEALPLALSSPNAILSSLMIQIGLMNVMVFILSLSLSVQTQGLFVSCVIDREILMKCGTGMTGIHQWVGRALCENHAELADKLRREKLNETPF